MTQLPLLTLLAALLPAVISTAQAQERAAAADDQPRQVILIIGDGMDEQQVTIARNYLKGARGQLLLDQLPVRGASQILTIEDKVDGKALYVADSANTATSMATGEVTSRGRIGTSAGDDRDLTTIVELAAAKGLRTGIVTTASVTDATAASFAAHINFRLCENPDTMEQVVMNDIYLGSCAQDLKRNGGQGSISEQLVASDLDVILGGGEKHFAVPGEGSAQSVLEQAETSGFQLVTSIEELNAGSDGPRLLGLFSSSTMPVRMRGEGGRSAEPPEPSLLNHIHEYLGDVAMPAPMACEPNPEFARHPSLQQMTEAALKHLSADNNSGFFLMVESASIDKEAHRRNPCGSIGEVEQLEEALASALAFAESHPRTLILVTADHSQAAQIIPHQSLYALYPIPIFSPGSVAIIQTPEGGNMAVNYATNNFIAEEHTGAAVPLYSNAEGIGIVPTFVQQPQLFQIMKNYLAL